MADLVIRINGDIKSFEDALEKVSDQTLALENNLAKIAQVSGLAFAALTAEIGVSVAAFAESQKASRELTASLQNQGIYSKQLADDYKQQAADLQTLTGVDDDAIVKSQALLQSFLGQTKVTKPLELAILDLSAAKGMDLQSTTDLIGKGIEGHTAALQKLGIHIDENLSKEERQAKIIEQVTLKFGGQAAAANQGLGALKGLNSAFGDFQENIGEKFAPFIEAAIKGMTTFLTYINQNKEVANFAAAIIIAGTAVSGLALAVSLGGIAFLKMKAAIEAAEIATGAMSLATKGLVGATGLGLLIIVVTEIYQHWNSIWPRMQAAFTAFTSNISELASALGAIFQGVFDRSPAAIKAAMDRVKEVMAKGFADYSTLVQKNVTDVAAIEAAGEEKQSAAKKAAAEKEKRERDTLAAYKKQQLQTEVDNEWQVLNNATAERIALGKQEADLLAKLQDEKYKSLREDLLTNLEETRQLIKEQDDLDDGYRADKFNALLANNEEYEAMSDAQKAQFRQKNEAELLGSIQNEKTTRDLAAKQKLETEIAARNQFLVDQAKFGIAYATINKLMHSEIYQGSKQAFGELAQLQQSSNSTLKTIGKAAAVANIIIKTGESAMNIFAGFSTIPFIGPALGIAGAAAAVAFGAEQVGLVLGAAEGGLITGGIPGVDSVPVMAQHMELISPAKNFDEVIGSVRAGREAKKFMGEDSGESGGGSGFAHMTIEFLGDFAEMIEAKIVERQNLGISLLGAGV